MTFEVTVNGHDYRVELEQTETGSWTGRVNGEAVAVNAANTAAGVLSMLMGGESYEIVANPAQQQVAIGGIRYSVEVRDPGAHGVLALERTMGPGRSLLQCREK